MTPSAVRLARAQRGSMIALVVLNLAFVALTEGARWIWLGPLFGLALFGPLLLPLTRFFAYRATWNLAVLGAFAMLVRHVSSKGIDRLLEDGLLLAALCQVHLLNNLTAKQKPDLLYFNSFLIAVMTSFLVTDAIYCGLFIVYGLTLIVALQLWSLVRIGCTDRPNLVRRCVIQGLVRGAAVTAVAFVVFLFLPRDFERRGLLGDFRIDESGAFVRVEFNDRIDTRSPGAVSRSERVVMKMRMREGRPERVPLYWRGATQDRFDGRHWVEGNRAVVYRPWRRTGRLAWERDVGEPEAVVDITLVGPVPTHLFVPLRAAGMTVDPEEPWRRVGVAPDLTFRHTQRLKRRFSFRYSVSLAAPRAYRPPESMRRAYRYRRGLQAHLALPEDASPIARSLARSLLKDFDRPSQAARVEHLRSHLAANHDYVLPGGRGAARTLDAFIRGDAGGHCELFASTLAIMLRSEAIPCRLVTGYRIEPWNNDGKPHIVTSATAHAWVEVLDPDRGWTTVDPTPAAGGSALGGEGWLASTEAWITKAWGRVTGFDDERRAAVLAWFVALPERSWGFARRHPDAVLAMFGLGLLWIVVRRRRHVRFPAVVAWERAARRCGVTRRPDETPRELLARARADGGDATKLDALAAATAAHERARYREGTHVASALPEPA